MSWQSKLRSVANRALRPLGFQLLRHHEAVPPPSRWTMQAALERIASLGIRPATFIDVGAASGEWTRIAQAVFPDARGLLMEPISAHRSALDALVLNRNDDVVESAVAGESDGTITFNVTEDPDGSGVYGQAGGGTLVTVPQFRIDTLVSRHALKGPFLLKLDTHGYELPIFRGAEQTLAQTELIVVEAYGFRPSPSAVRFWELAAWLGERGFRPADICGLMGRKRDGLFWQADLLFLRNEHPAFESDSFI